MAHTLLDRPVHHRLPLDRVPTDRADGPPDPPPADRFARARAVLDEARGVLERGWLQHGWYQTRPTRPRSLRDVLRRPDRPPAVDEVHAACLVAAVALAAHGGGPRLDVFTDAGPVLDVVWDALCEQQGRPGPPVAGRAAAPTVRAARMHDLVRWNDEGGRSRDDVLALLDRAVSRTILDAVRAGQRPVAGVAAR